MNIFAKTLLLSAATFTVSCSAQTEQNSQDANQAVGTYNDRSAEAVELAEYLKYDTFTLDNGLRVIVHEDRSSPLVSISVTVHVGSKDEPEGKSGFAHLFEHMLFRGTERNPGDIFDYLRALGGTNMNGSTSRDVTDYFETVPTGALERALWLESDRIENVYKTVDAEVLKTEIEIVKNEKAGSDSGPFSGFENEQVEAIYPEGHPYSHRIIGSIEDLESASVEDIKAWYEKYYGARNTILTLSGDLDLETAKTLVEKYFSHIPAGPALLKQERSHVKRLTNTVQHIHDVAPSSSLTRTYLLPPTSDEYGYHINLSAELFADGTHSRFHQDLVENWKLATRVSGGTSEGEIDNQLQITVEPAEGVSLNEISDAVDRSLAIYFKEGPSQSDLDTHYGNLRGNIASGLESPSRKGSLLTYGYVLFDDPHYLLRQINWSKSAKVSNLKALAKEYLSVGYHEVQYIASKPFEAKASTINLNIAPPVKASEAAKLPEPEIFTLSNGLDVVFKQRSKAPRIEFHYSANAGAKDFPTNKRVDINALRDLLDRSVLPGLSREEQSVKFSKLQAGFSVNISEMNTTASLSASSEAIDESLDAFAAALIDGEVEKKDFTDYIEKKIEQTLKDKESPSSIARDIYLEMRLGDVNYDTLDEELVAFKQMEISELEELREALFRPDGAKLFVVGDISRERLETVLEEKFSRWSGKALSGEMPAPQIPAQLERPKFIIVEDKTLSQTVVATSRYVRNLKGNPIQNSHAESTMNSIFGGNFSSRLNQNIRGEKGYTYSIGSSYRATPNKAMWAMYTNVTADKAVETIEEVIKEIEELRTTRPISKQDLEKQIDTSVRAKSGSYGNNLEVLFGYKDGFSDYGRWDAMNDEIDKLKTLTTSDMDRVAKNVVDTKDLLWLVSGDLKNFEDELRVKNLGDIEVYDSKGNRLR